MEDEHFGMLEIGTNLSKFLFLFFLLGSWGNVFVQ